MTGCLIASTSVAGGLRQFCAGWTYAAATGATSKQHCLAALCAVIVRLGLDADHATLLVCENSSWCYSSGCICSCTVFEAQSAGHQLAYKTIMIALTAACNSIDFLHFEFRNFSFFKCYIFQNSGCRRDCHVVQIIHDCVLKAVVPLTVGS